MTDYVPHTDDDREQMLRDVGVDALTSLFDDVPSDLRFPDLDLPQPCAEAELSSIATELAGRNHGIDISRRFLGAGTYYHDVPAVVDDVLSRGEFYTSYTPYQPELSQGMLQATFEYQSMICQLTGMEISNASHYDGATSLAEAVLMAMHLRDKPQGEVLMSPGVNPNMRAVVDTYLQGTGASVITPSLEDSDAEQFIDIVNKETFAVVVQQPDFFGALGNLQAITDAAHAAGALVIVVTDMVFLGLFKPPGEYDVDIVVADGQCLGMPPMFGGPSLGVLATRRTFARRLAGRLVGETVDSHGERCYVLTLATREQHIRRARATSNICTNAALSALAASVYLASVGKHGLREIANVCYQRSHYAAAAIAALPNVSINPWFRDRPFYCEFVVALPRPVEEINLRLYREFGLLGGYDLSRDYPQLSHHMLLTVTEVNTKSTIDALAFALDEITK